MFSVLRQILCDVLCLALDNHTTWDSRTNDSFEPIHFNEWLKTTDLSNTELKRHKLKTLYNKIPFIEV